VVEGPLEKSSIWAFLAVLAFACAGHGARADSDGWVLLVKPAPLASVVPIVRVNEFGKIFARTYNFTDGDFLLASWAHGFVGYDRKSNFTCGFQVTEDGGRNQAISCAKALGSLSSVTKLVAFGEFIFGYDGGALGQITQYTIDPVSNAPVSKTTEVLGLSSWNNIFATKNYVFFYRKSSGVYATGTINDTGQFVQYDNGTISTGYEFFAKVGDTLVAYDPKTGKYEVDAINLAAGSGPFSVTLAKQSSGTIDKGYSTVAALGNALVWHSGSTGATLVGYIGRTPATIGQWVQTSKSKGDPGYTVEVAAGSSILFYNAANGVAVADTVSPAGVLTETDRTIVGIGYTQVGVTTR
jgi:hypothetical protein